MSRRALAEIAVAVALVAAGGVGTATGWARDTTFHPDKSGMADYARHDISLLLEANGFEIRRAEANEPFMIAERDISPVLIEVAPNERTAGQTLPAATFDVAMEYRWCMSSFKTHVDPTPQPEPRDGP